jgi:hypothetical protein
MTMTTLEIGKQLVELCKQHKNHEAMEKLYAPDIVSVEAAAPPSGGSAEVRGIEAVIAKSKWWAENNTIHSGTAEGPWPHGDRFIVRFTYEVTFKPTNERRKLDETALFTVKNGKIVREEFFYPT